MTTTAISHLEARRPVEHSRKLTKVEPPEHLIKGVLALVSSAHAAIDSSANAAGLDALNTSDPECLCQQAWQRYQRHYLAVNGQHAQVCAGVQAGLAYLEACGLETGLPDQQTGPPCHCSKPVTRGAACRTEP